MRPDNDRTEAPATDNAADIRQYLAFELAGDPYAVDILKVQEIRGYEPVRELPEAPRHIKGVIDLRGTILPVMDLRERFGMARVEYAPTTVVIVLALHCAAGEQAVGVVVDAVSDVLEARPDAVRPPPLLGDGLRARFLRGVLPGERMVMLLDADELLAAEDLQAFGSGLA